MSTDTTPDAKFGALVAALSAQGLTMGGVSKVLGYAGTNGARDVAAVRAGRSKKHASVDAACDVLRAALRGATADPPGAAPAKPAAPPAAPAKPAAAPAAASDPEHEFDALVAQLTATKGLTPAAVTELLGYSGKNGARDLASIRAGTSKKFASVAEACALLERALNADGTGGAGKPASSHHDAGASTKPAAAKEPPLEERFDGLVAAAVARGETHNGLSALLGYAGKNGKRDLDTVRGGKSKTVTLAQAVAVLADAGGEAPAAPSAATGDDGGAAPAVSGAPTKGAPATKDAAPSAPAPLPKVWGGDASPASSPAPSKAQAAAPPPPASTASAAADPVARFDAAVAVRKGRGDKEGSISALLGYSGKNGKRDLDAVRSGKSTKHTVTSACAVLEAA